MQVLCYLPSKSHTLVRESRLPYRTTAPSDDFRPFHGPGPPQKFHGHGPNILSLRGFHHGILLETWGWSVSYAHVMANLHFLRTAQRNTFRNIPHFILPDDLLATVLRPMKSPITAPWEVSALFPCTHPQLQPRPFL